ncbi:DNA repair protein REV1 isoform X4 [Carettochelys insculpta]|uniref:DNA repair protein REV1 isoform X4 n=1 Tax=Carettochelys insculpta TaxID=44489 RepID=UPI003EBB5618
MRRGGWRKRASNDDGWGTWGGYMSAKIQKLEDQFQSDASIQHHKDGPSSAIFSGVAIYVNGLTDPSADELRRLMMLHGGQYHVYYSRSKTTHIIATNLPSAKIKELKGEKVVRPEWIVESIKAGRLLSYIPYQLYSKQSSVQKVLNFNTICKPEEPMPGPSNITDKLNNRVNCVIKKYENENEIKANGTSGCDEEEKKESEDLVFMELDQVFPGRKQNGIQHHRGSTAIFNGHTHSSISALQTQDCVVPSGNRVASRFSSGSVQEDGKTEKDTIDFRDCSMQQLQESNKNTVLLKNPHRTTSNVSVLSSSKHQRCIMHMDMDCFFVSVGIRNRPDLQGKPVAVTSNRGAGRVPLRPGANPQLEWHYYQNKTLNGKAECRVPDKLDSPVWENPDSVQMNGAELDISGLSMAEIASCSYEARQVGVKNGMFFGQAKQLCPSLQAVPYDFNAYKEVTQTVYETLASYTHNIEAVSCDEALVDITEILGETRMTPEEFASAIRTEIKDKTKCAASVGMGSNILLARMATRKAKPDGQYHLKPEEVDDFIRVQLVSNLPGVGRSMESKLASLGIKTCGDLQYLTMSKLQKEFGPKTGQMLYRFCRGLDDRPVRTEKERKSVSAEINYGIRFSQPKEAEAFLLSLSEEIQHRLEAAGMKGKRLTLKIMVRKAGAPVEPAKFGGHGICDNIARTVTLDHATDSAKVIGKETLNMFHTMKLNISDMRGVGIQVHQLVPINKTSSAISSRSSVPSGHLPGGSHSVIDLLHVQKAKKHLEEKEHKEVFMAAMDLEISSSSRTCTFLPSLTTHVTSGLNPVTSKAESAVKWNGFHNPISVKSRLNLSIEVPSLSQLDQSVLEALPSDLREQVEQMYGIQQGETYADSKKEPINGCNNELLPQPIGTVLLQIPDLQGPNSDAGINVIALPAFSQVDPEVYAALPTELQEELKNAYDQRQKQSEDTYQQPARTLVSKNPLLQLKQATVKTKKKTRKKNQVSPMKKVQSPLKNKLFASPAKNVVASSGSPQKLIDGFLNRDGTVIGKSQVEPVPSTSDTSGPSAQQTAQSGSVRPPVPNLAGAVEFSDVKTLLKEWITTISDPMEEDILQVVKYCTDLIEEKDLEKLDLVIKYMKRLMQQSVESVWTMAFDFILDNVQVVLQQTYGSTLKVI